MIRSNYMFVLFKGHTRILAAISERRHGSCRLLPSGSTAHDEQARRNREQYLSEIGVSPDNVVSALLVHGNGAAIVGPSEAGKDIPNVDGLITREKGIFLSITVADCMPIFFYDPAEEVVGIAHAGWRGLTRGIISATLEKFRQAGTLPQNLLVAIGPHIGSCHFEIQEDVASVLRKLHQEFVVERGGKVFADLKGMARAELVTSGISEGNIEISAECTYCSKEKYFSYRRDKPEILETMMAVIGIRE